MSIEIRLVETKKDREVFINLPKLFHKDHKNWVPPIYMDDRNFFNPSKNKCFLYSDTVLAIAYRERNPVGRIMGIINRKYNESHQENDGRFCFMECAEDKDVFHALITYIENWLRSKGMTNIVGPLGFSDKDPQGFMIEGFNEPIVLATNGNKSYMPQLLEIEGFIKKVDCVVYKVPIPDK